MWALEGGCERLWRQQHDDWPYSMHTSRIIVRVIEWRGGQ